MKVIVSVFILLTAMIFSVFTGCVSFSDATVTTWNTTAPATEVPAQSTALPTEADVTATQAAKDYTGAYDDLLFDLYKQILAIVYDPEDCEYMEGDSGISEVVRSLTEPEALEKVGYAIMDINGDSVPELFIFEVDGLADVSWIGTRIIAAYTLKDDSPAFLFEGVMRDRYYLINDNLIYNEGVYGTVYSYFGTYTLEEFSDNLKTEIFYFASPIDDDYSNIGHFQNKTGEMDVEQSEKFSGTDDDLWAIQTGFAEETKEVEVTPFEVFSAGDEDENSGISYVTAVFLEDTLADVSEGLYFQADDSGEQRDVVFFANNSEVSYFRFCTVNLLDNGEYDYNPIYTVDTLSPDTPLTVSMTFFGDTPAYGIVYVDSNGIDIAKTVNLSGVDNSLVLE